MYPTNRASSSDYRISHSMATLNPSSCVYFQQRTQVVTSAPPPTLHQGTTHSAVPSWLSNQQLGRYAPAPPHHQAPRMPYMIRSTGPVDPSLSANYFVRSVLPHLSRLPSPQHALPSSLPFSDQQPHGMLPSPQHALPSSLPFSDQQHHGMPRMLNNGGSYAVETPRDHFSISPNMMVGGGFTRKRSTPVEFDFQQPPKQGQWMAPPNDEERGSPPLYHPSDDSAAGSDSEDAKSVLEDISSPLNIDKLVGERRLIITFESFGRCSRTPARMGKNGVIVPNGLIGRFTAYGEEWRVSITYDEEERDPCGVIRILWSITNVRTNATHFRRETVHEASARTRSGRTITNQLFREAMIQRALHLEVGLKDETNPIRIANIRSLIKTLQPTRFTQGPLFFGLQHRSVQEKMLLFIQDPA